MPNRNQVILEGHVGQDPELKYSQTGTAIAKFSVATNNNIKGKEVTEWSRIVAFGMTAEGCVLLHKSDPVIVIGRISTDKWTDKEENVRYTTNIIADSVALNVIKGVPKKPRGDGRPTPPPMEKDTDIPF
jgi:single-strand DNA-binding protein